MNFLIVLLESPPISGNERSTSLGNNNTRAKPHRPWRTESENSRQRAEAKRGLATRGTWRTVCTGK